MNLKKKTKKKNDFNLKFLPFLTFGSLPQQHTGLSLYPYFLWYIRHPPTHKYFFFGAKILFSYLVARNWGHFKFLVDVLYWEKLVSLWERGARLFSSMKPSVNSHINEIIVNGKIMFHVCILTFITFRWEFSVWEYFICLSVHWKSQESVYYYLVITLWK